MTSNITLKKKKQQQQQQLSMPDSGNARWSEKKKQANSLGEIHFKWC